MAILKLLTLLSLNLCFVSEVWWHNVVCAEETPAVWVYIAVPYCSFAYSFHDALWAQDSSGPTPHGVQWDSKDTRQAPCIFGWRNWDTESLGRLLVFFVYLNQNLPWRQCCSKKQKWYPFLLLCTSQPLMLKMKQKDRKDRATQSAFSFNFFLPC